MTEEPSMRDFTEENVAPKVVVLDMDDAKIRHMARNPEWSATACDLEGDELGVHTYLKIELRYTAAKELASVTVLDCDRKDGR